MPVALLAVLSVFPGFEKELRILPHLVRAGQVCVDVGASFGAYTIPLALVVGAGGCVVAVEPRLRAASALTRVSRMLGLECVHVRRTALGSSAGREQLVVPRTRWRAIPGRAHLATGVGPVEGASGVSETESVPVTTLDALRLELGRPIDFVKCDVEGAELDVIDGGTHTLGTDRPTLLLEVEERHTRRYGHRRDDVLDRLADLGYRTWPSFRTSERNHLLVPVDADRPVLAPSTALQPARTV
ncbi:MAG: FkbM family methyltransferase [Acidimicrobiia bacterium]|nr:FkbM family methyltransferase [Acidimicrobiia bacterium]